MASSFDRHNERALPPGTSGFGRHSMHKPKKLEQAILLLDPASITWVFLKCSLMNEYWDKGITLAGTDTHVPSFSELTVYSGNMKTFSELNFYPGKMK